jgi:hypothetical protein
MGNVPGRARKISYPVAFEESKAAGGTPAAWTDIIGIDQFFISTGGALNSSLTANSIFDMVCEPPFDGFMVQKRVYHSKCYPSRNRRTYSTMNE